MIEFSELIGLFGVVLGVLLGFLGQLILTRREEARRLDQARRELYTQFLAASKYALDHLAEGGLNRINGAVQRGAYGGQYIEDQQQLTLAISGMELVSTRTVLTKAERFLNAHWEFATSESNAEPVDRSTIDEATFSQISAEFLERLKQLSGIKGEFLTAAKQELQIISLVDDRSEKG